jgi:serine/threonine protein kinase
MEYLAGETLSSALECGTLTPKQSRSIALQLAKALRAAHEKSILHRDFKPANAIFTKMDSEPRAIATDFGLARAFGESEARNVYSLRAGTLDYMAPELLENHPATVQSDLSAYGKVLSKLLPGHSLIAKLIAEDPKQRPESMVPVIDHMKGNTAAERWGRRAWIAAAGCGIGGFLYWRERGPQVPLGSRQRVILNGLRGSVESNSGLLAIRRWNGRPRGSQRLSNIISRLFRRTNRHV